MAEKELDLFGFLNQLQSCYPFAYDDLTDAAKKETAPLVVQRWLTGSCSENQLIYHANLSNRFIFTLGKHPSLVYKIISACSDGVQRRAKWIKGPSKKSKSKSLIIKVLMDTLGCSQREAQDLVPLVNKDDIIDEAKLLGWDDAELKSLKTEFK